MTLQRQCRLLLIYRLKSSFVLLSIVTIIIIKSRAEREKDRYKKTHIILLSLECNLNAATGGRIMAVSSHLLFKLQPDENQDLVQSKDTATLFNKIRIRSVLTSTKYEYIAGLFDVQ